MEMDHTIWVYGAITAIFLWNSWMSIKLISVYERSNRWGDVDEKLNMINRKLDMFIKQEIDTLKEMAKR